MVTTYVWPLSLIRAMFKMLVVTTTGGICRQCTTMAMAKKRIQHVDAVAVDEI